MPQSKEQGTGKHPHKSAEDPRPHNEAPTTTGRKEASSSKSNAGGEHSSSKGEQGTGKHPHKSAEDPRPHNEASSGRKESASTHSSSSKNESDAQSRGESDNDLKGRQYTGPDGEIHHHTTKYAEQHKGEKKAS